MKPILLVIVGPTAIGKTDLSVRLAQRFQTEILSADSRQFYQEMGIGTAKPTKAEMKDVPHHFVDFLSVKDDYTAGQFEVDALQKLRDLFKSKKVVVLVGGSGLFVDAVCKGLDPIPRDLVIREELNSRYAADGLSAIVQELESLDPAVCKEIDLNNPMRVIRALEVCLATGSTYTSFRKKAPKDRFFETVKIGLNTDRNILYDRINRRCDLMMEAGWEEEARSLLDFKHLNALNTVGYKELFSYFKKEVSLEECIRLIKQHTRNFAKRQLTWFKKDPAVTWLDPMDSDSFYKVVKIVKSKMG